MKKSNNFTTNNKEEKKMLTIEFETFGYDRFSEMTEKVEKELLKNNPDAYQNYMREVWEMSSSNDGFVVYDEFLKIISHYFAICFV